MIFRILAIVIVFQLPVIARAYQTVQEIITPMVAAKYTNNPEYWTDARILKDQQERITIYEKESLITKSGWFEAAEAYAYCGQVEKSISLIKGVLNKDPDNIDAHNFLGLIYMGQRNMAEAAKHLQRSWDLGSKQFVKLLAYAYLYTSNEKELGLLAPSLLQSKGQDQQCSDALVLYSRMLNPHDTNLFLKAVEGLSDDFILKQEERFRDGYVLGFWETGHEARARGLLAKAQKTNTDAADILLFNDEQLEQVIGNYEKDTDSWKPDELFLAAIAYAKQGKYETAKPLYIKYLKTNPNDKRAHRGLGGVYLSQKKRVKAEAEFEKGWRLGDSDSLKLLAFIYKGDERFDELSELVPDMLKFKSQDMELVPVMIDFALDSDPPDRELFSKAMAGVTDELILQHPDLISDFVSGLEKFGEKKRAKSLKEKAAKIKVPDK